MRWSQAPGPVTSFYRMSIAALMLLPVILAPRGHCGHRCSAASVAALADLSRCWAGLFTALDHGTWSTAIASTRVANATLLNNMAPLWVALFAALVWRERLRGRFWLGLVVTLGGAAVVSGQWTCSCRRK